jgi:hypothetical protein
VFTFWYFDIAIVRINGAWWHIDNIVTSRANLIAETALLNHHQFYIRSTAGPYKYRQCKLLKKSQGTLSSRLFFCHPIIVLCCPGAPKPWFLLSSQWTVFITKASSFHLQSAFLSKTCWSKNAEAAENGHICHFLSVFQRSVTHSRVVPEAHQAVTIKVRVCCVCVCAVSAF